MSDPRPLGFRTLLDYVEGRLEPSEAARVRRELEGGADPRAAELVEWLGDLHDLTERHRLEQPPPLVADRLGQHFRRWAGQPAAPLDQEVAVGSLVFDSRVPQARTGTRSTGTSGTSVRLAFESELGDLLLDVDAAEPGLLKVEGQVLADGDTSPFFDVEVKAAETTVRSVDGDELGRFVLDRVPAEPVRVTASNGELSIVVDVDLTGVSPP